MSEERTPYQTNEVDYQKDQEVFLERQRMNALLITHNEPYKTESSE